MAETTARHWLRRVGAGALGLTLAAASTVAASASAPRAAEPVDLGVTVDDLGTLGGADSAGWGINDEGVVVGESRALPSGTHAFRWDPVTAMMDDLGTLGGSTSAAYAVNEAGFVVGESRNGDGQTHAFVWDPTTEEMTDLGTLGGTRSGAYGINDDGMVVGFSQTTDDEGQRAFLWDPTTEDMTDLGTLGGSESYATGINADGVVVGVSDIGGDEDEHAFAWDPTTEEMTDLGTLGGAESNATGINADGLVVGSSQVSAGGPYHAFVWDPTTEEMTDLGTMGGTSSRATAISDAGFVVGRSLVTGDTAEMGFVWSPVTEEMTSLGALEGNSSEPQAINTEGTIAGTGRLAPASSSHAVRWVSPFSDVALVDLFYLDIIWLVAEEITTGFDDGTFRPTAANTRQAMAAFLYRLAGEPEFEDPATPSFSDVPANHPFFHEIEWLADSGVTGGFPDGTFRPGTSISRQSMAAFLYRLAGEPEFVDPVTPSFSDVATADLFFHEIEWLADSGVTGGFPDGTFRPGVTVSRQSMAAFLHRFADLG